MGKSTDTGQIVEPTILPDGKTFPMRQFNRAVTENKMDTLLGTGTGRM
jgi:hypothetical protein